MAVEMRDEMAALSGKWRKLGHELGFGIGISHGYATLGCIGFAGRLQYSATGSVANLACRLCAEAHDGQILIDTKVRGVIDGLVTVESAGDLTLKGFRSPVSAFSVGGLVAQPAL
jgi:class 3 adenylate cyclase